MTILYILAALACLSGFLAWRDIAKQKKESDFLIWQILCI